MTDTEEMTLAELRTAEPREFEKRYWKWVEHQCQYKWWTEVYERFVEEVKAEGFEMDIARTGFSLSYSQGDHAAIAGTLDMVAFMRSAGYEETHLALVLEMQEWGAYAKVGATHRGGVSVDIRYYPGNTTPTGVFADLPQEAWEELTAEQWEAEDWDKLVREWVKGKNQELYQQLDNEYEYLTSEEQFINQGDDQ
jgi:hypothetical protein